MNKKIALLSVFYKEGIVEFARELVNMGWTILSSSGTFRALTQAGIPVTDVAEITGQGPILRHRVVTLQPHIHGGLLAAEEMLQELEELNYPWIDLVCVDLYPIKEEIAKPDATRASVIEKTDIGGPTMIRSGAKGRRIVICDRADRQAALVRLREGTDNPEWRNDLAAKAEAVIADYCLASARFHSNGDWDGVVLRRVATCRYGENAWQMPAALYAEIGNQDPLALNHFQCVQGRPPSYNNWCDVDRALQTITHIAAGCDVNLNGKVPYIAVGVKHGNACGAAVGSDPATVLKNMLAGDPRAIFGGVVMTNFPLHERLAALLRKNKDGSPRLLDLIAAPSIFPNSREILTWKDGRGALLCNPALARLSRDSLDHAPRLKHVRGGALMQPNYTHVPVIKEMDFHMGETDLEVPILDAVLAWGVCATSNSNTITIVKNGMLLGNGVGQQDRVGAAELAVKRANDAGHNEELIYSVAWSDSFFPFRDGVDVLAKAGVTHILATSGSKNDRQVINAAVDACVSISLLPDAEARCFYGH